MGDTSDAGAFSLPLTTYSARGNGRVNLSATAGEDALGDGRKAGTFPGFGYQKTSEVSFHNDMLRGNWEHNQLSDSFFSQKNVQLIQNSIRRYVYDRSTPKGYLIDDQSVDELKIIMRAIYYQYARNLPHDIQGQVDELNKRVVDWSGPHILSAVDHYIYYLKDIDSMPVPLSHPVHLSRAGSKTLPLQPYM
jgi:hypothetical protein